jgi:hypothetical protein
MNPFIAWIFSLVFLYRFFVIQDKIRMFLPLDDCKVITACIVLHNIAMKHGDHIDPLAARNKAVFVSPNPDETYAGKRKRNHILRGYFAANDNELQRV